MNSISLASNQQNYFNPNLIKPEHAPEVLRDFLRQRGCNGCNLGLQEDYKGPVVFRGNPKASRMIIGEAPGLHEDINGIPFIGPAGQELSKMWTAMEWDLDKDWYITNVIKCRPVALRGSGRQNLTPKALQIKSCKPYIIQEIKSINPSIVVILGAVAAKALLPKQIAGKNQTQLAGKVLYSNEFPGITFFIMFHPAYLLHSQGTEKYPQLKKDNWGHIQLLKEIIDDIE